MASIILKSLSNPQQLTDSNILDTSKPLNYHAWLKQNIAVIPDQAEQQYQKYLLDWYSQKNTALSLSTNQNKIKEDYISLLKRVSVLFKDDPEFERFTRINFESPTELKLAIPFYARKLKEIALYFASKREDLKKSKLQYNLVGSSNALEKILYEQLLKAFTKNPGHISKQSIFSSVPELSAVSNDFTIEVEELYDMNNYFHNSEYYSLSSTNPLLFVLEDYIANFYNILDVSEIPLSGFSNPLSQFTLCENHEELNEQVLAQLGEKRIGNNIYQLSGGYYAPDIKPISLDFKTGNNYFYWFQGEYAREIPEGIFKDTKITDIDWTNATGNSAIELSDIIWSNVGNLQLEGAWLQDSDFSTVNANMTATMSDGKIFKFPYPGFGLSAEGLEWSGKSITDLVEPSRRFFPSESSYLDNQEKVKDLYWSNTSSITSVNSILIQDANLNQFGHASKNYKNADKLIIRQEVGDDFLHDTNPDEVFTGERMDTWLYKFDQTDIPIKLGTNNLYYPLTAFDKSEDLFFLYDSGDDVALSAINVGGSFAGAIAGNTISDSDVIIKLNSVCGPELEAAYLKGFPLSAFNPDLNSCSCDGDFNNFYTRWKFRTGVTQPSLSFKVNPGEFVRFLWTGPRTNINDVFPGFDHDHSCEYYKEKNHPSILDTNFLNKSKKDVYEQWKKCNCKTVNHSPLGHNSVSLDSYKVIPDFIARDSTYPSPFSFNTWKGQDNETFRTSNDLAWFRNKNQLERDIGWSGGQWLTNKDEEFFLEQGQTYWYYRSDINRCGFDLPYLIVNKCYQECIVPDCTGEDCIPVWTKAIQQDDGTWLESNEVSDMVMENGSFYTYIHRSNSKFSKEILTYNNAIFTTSGDFVSLSATDPLIQYQSITTETPAINFLIKISLENNEPYWGNVETQYNLNKFDFRNELDYLQMIQPIPTNLELTDNMVLEYKSTCGNCFVWEQPLEFHIHQPTRRWNKILVDDCTKSDILNHLHEKCNTPCELETGSCYSQCPEVDICGCSENCYKTKTGVTATNIPSEMAFNTELSGIPVFVNYFARNGYTLDFSVEDITNGGIYVPAVSTLFSEATLPWRNISNDFNPFAALEQGTEFYTREQRGLFTPDKLGTGKWELRDGKYELNTSTRSVTSVDLIRDEYDLDVISTNSSWMKNWNGNIKVDSHQTYYPYTSNNETDIINGLGLQENYILNYESLSANERGQKLINCGENAYYNNLMYLTGNVIDWQQDVWGNQYFLINDSDEDKTKTRLENNTKSSKVYVKTIDGKIVQL